MKLSDAYVYDAVRTPRGKGKEGGSLSGVPPHELVAQLLRALRTRVPEDAVTRAGALTLGCVGQFESQGGNIALVSRLHAGLPHDVPAMTLNNFCVSGLTTAGLAAQAASAGEARMMIAGGVEMMSQAPFMGDKASYYADPALAKALKYAPVALSADLMATKEGFSKEALDVIALRSHQRAAKAWADGLYAASVVPVAAADGSTTLAHDELVRPDLTLEKLAALPPAFQEMGRTGFDEMMLLENPDLTAVKHVHSVADCPGMADGAALALIGSKAAGEAHGLAAKARVLAWTEATGDPVDQLTAGFAAMERVCAETGFALSDFDRIEFMEAFAAVPAKFEKDYAPDMDAVNVNGGHLAMGHPMGASGAILLTGLVHELARIGGGRGLVVAHGGSGVGSAMVVERL